MAGVVRARRMGRSLSRAESRPSTNFYACRLRRRARQLRRMSELQNDSAGKGCRHSAGTRRNSRFPAGRGGASPPETAPVPDPIDELRVSWSFGGHVALDASPRLELTRDVKKNISVVQTRWLVQLSQPRLDRERKRFINGDGDVRLTFTVESGDECFRERNLRDRSPQIQAALRQTRSATHLSKRAPIADERRRNGEPIARRIRPTCVLRIRSATSFART